MTGRRQILAKTVPILGSIGTSQAFTLQALVDRPRPSVIASVLGWRAGLLMSVTAGAMTDRALPELAPRRGDSNLPESQPAGHGGRGRWRLLAGRRRVALPAVPDDCMQRAPVRYREIALRTVQWRNWSYGCATRHLECPVHRQSLLVTPQPAFAQATVEAEPTACLNYGAIVTFDPDTGEPGFEPGPFTGLVTVEATLLDPTCDQSSVSNAAYRDKAIGQTQRETRHGGSAWRLNGGGMILFGTCRAFGPSDADGSFSCNSCGVTTQ